MTEINRHLSPLALPALRARMGDWVYYICFLKMQDIAERISIAGEIHKTKSLQDLLQRELTSRSVDIKDYLLSQEQRFFNALVVGTYGGSPTWYELAIKNDDTELESLPDYIEGTLGILKLNGSEILFAIDGQHRVAGIREAVAARSTLGDEEVCVIFLKGVTSEHRTDDPENFERTRRLFTKLNRYAKPVNKQEIIALDEDDVVAIVTRHLVDEYPLFVNKISLAKAKNIPVKDQSSLTTIVTLYDALDTFLPPSRRKWADFKKIRPSDDVIDNYYQRSVELWDILTKYFSPLQELKGGDQSDGIAGKYRNKDGGHLLFRPVGLLIVVKVIKTLIDSGITLEDVVERISKVPMDLNSEPWVGLLWDATNRRMMTAPERQKVGTRLLYHAVGGNLARLRTNEEELREELAGLLNKDIAQVSLFSLDESE